MATTIPYNYNAYPSPTGGSNTATGMVPGPINLPNPAGDLAGQIPNLGGINASIFGNLYDQSRGIIPQGDVNFMRDQSAARAVGGGMPGLSPGSLFGNQNARNLGLLSYQLQQQAAQQYPSLTGAVSQTQTVNPALQTQIAEQNALNAAAPNPQMAQSYAQQLYNKYLQAARGPGGGTGGISGPAGGSWQSQPQNQSPEPNYKNPPAVGGTGGGSYEGYVWDAGKGEYVVDPNWWKSQTGYGNSWGGPSSGTAGTGTTNFFGTGSPADTYYNPSTNTSNYNYGIPNYWDQGPADSTQSSAMSPDEYDWNIDYGF